METNDLKQMELDAKLALSAQRFEDAEAVAAALLAEIPGSVTEARALADTLSALAETAMTARPKADTFVTQTLWGRVLAFQAVGELDAAFHALADFEHSSPSGLLDAGWRGEVTVTRITLLYAAERFDEVFEPAKQYLAQWVPEDAAGHERLVEGLWLWSSVLRKVRAGADLSELVRSRIRRLLNQSNIDFGLAAARGSQRGLWWALVTSDGDLVIDVIAELVSALDAAVDSGSEIAIAEILLEVNDWLLGDVSASLPEMDEWALAISRSLISRFGEADTTASLQVLALARWQEYRGHLGLDHPEDAERAVVQVVEMGLVAADVLGKLLADLPDVDVPEVRAYGLNMAVVRAVTLAALDDHHEEGLALLDAGIARYLDDASPLVQQCVAWAQDVRAQVAD